MTNWIAKQWDAVLFDWFYSNRNKTVWYSISFNDWHQHFSHILSWPKICKHWNFFRAKFCTTFFVSKFVSFVFLGQPDRCVPTSNLVAQTLMFSLVRWSFFEKTHPASMSRLAYNETNQFFPYVGSHVPTHQLRCLESRLLGKRTCPKGVGCDCSPQSRKTHQGSVSTLGFSRHVSVSKLRSLAEWFRMSRGCCPIYREPHLENMVSHSLSSHGWFCGVSIGGKLMEIRGFSNQLWLEKATSLFVAMA